MKRKEFFDVLIILIFNLIGSVRALRYVGNLFAFTVLVSISCIISTAIFFYFYTKAKEKIEVNPESKTKIGLSFAIVAIALMEVVLVIFELISKFVI